MEAQARVVLDDGVVSVKEEVGLMKNRQESEAPVFSMRAKPDASGERQQVLGSDIARALTGLLTASRGGAGSFLDAGARLLATVAERGGDLVEQLRVQTILEDIYALLGIASAGAVVELDERVDDVELKMDDVARQRTREELMLLHQRLGELEAVMRSQDDGYDPAVDLGGLLGRLTELEARIDKIPWPEATGVR